MQPLHVNPANWPCPDARALCPAGTLTDGSKFDSSRDSGQKFEFKLGLGEVIKVRNSMLCNHPSRAQPRLLVALTQGWDEGVAQMSIGEVSVVPEQPRLQIQLQCDLLV